MPVSASTSMLCASPQPPSPPIFQGAGWREAVEEVFSDFLAASRLLMQALALALRLPRDYFTSQCDDPVAQMVMFR